MQPFTLGRPTLLPSCTPLISVLLVSQVGALVASSRTFRVALGAFSVAEADRWCSISVSVARPTGSAHQPKGAAAARSTRLSPYGAARLSSRWPVLSAKRVLVIIERLAQRQTAWRRPAPRPALCKVRRSPRLPPSADVRALCFQASPLNALGWL